MGDHIIENGADFLKKNGASVTVRGTYLAIPSPQKGPPTAKRAKTHATIKLEDGTAIYIEAFGTKPAKRDIEEIRRLNSRTVVATGTAWRVMPSPGAAPLAPCLTQVSDIHTD